VQASTEAESPGPLITCDARGHEFAGERGSWCVCQHPMQGSSSYHGWDGSHLCSSRTRLMLGNAAGAQFQAREQCNLEDQQQLVDSQHGMAY
jgi:hypothetical protein